MPVDGHASLGYDSGTNRITTAGFEYDAAGNQIKAPGPDGSGLLFEYDAAGRISVIRKEGDNSLVQAFQYGSTNARLMDTNYGFGYLKLFASTGGTTLAEYTEFTASVPTWTKSYTYLGEKQLATITPNGSGGEYVEFNHPDRLGTRLITNQAGGTTYEQVHFPFGTALNAESSITDNPRRFTSYDRSSATGLDYAINRTYDSKAGRFTQVDPIGMKSVDLNTPQSLNLYNYCGNDPINRTDPEGLSWLRKLWRGLKAAFSVLLVVAVVVAIVVPVISAIYMGIQVGIQVYSSAGLMAGIKAGLATMGTMLQPVGVALLRIAANEVTRMVRHTIYRNVKESVRRDGLSFGSVLRGFFRGLKQAAQFLWAAVTRKFPDVLIPIHGYFCAPRYGVDGPTGTQQPISELDRACKIHDEQMLQINEMYQRGQITKREMKRLKTKYDLQFMWRAAKSGHAPYGAIVQIAFFLRIVTRG